MTPALQLAGFLSVFLVRRIARRGVLRLPSVRWTIALAGLAAFVGFCAFGVVILRQLISEPEQLSPLLRVVGVSTPLWILTVFTVVRVLFMKASDLVELTFSFPLTNRARTLGFMLFESLVMGLGVVLMLGALVTGTISIGGFGILDQVITCLVMPSTVAYLVASVYYLGLERLLLRLRLARLRAFLVPVVLAATLVALYLGVSTQSESVLFAAVGQGDDYFAVQLLFADIAASHGTMAATGIWLAMLALLVCAVFAIAPRQFDPTRRFAIVPRLFGPTEFGAYFAAHIRGIETVTVCGISLAGSYALFLADIRLPPILLLAVTVQSVYAYVSTEPLRACGPRRHGPGMRYVLVIGPQLATLAIIASPISILSALTGARLDEILSVVGFAVSNVIVLTLAGIAFPPEKGNPFSVIAGAAVAGLVTGTIMLGTNLLGLPPQFTVGVMLALTLIAAALSIAGMDRIERTSRHEVVV
ncbi:hypothetical protein SOM10_10110 [Microbacterium sp. CFBP9023]|uniref:hypothetical protein n=1 Tax=unclassified Microbacterium TaxID=2609290 RepID=UPI002A6A190C|nr:hypothetical protein [Microbacterium sp. CFBP9023]MDY0984249.1 hypothetical protein [Microbacterium sp. CFBP9023]